MRERARTRMIGWLSTLLAAILLCATPNLAFAENPGRALTDNDFLSTSDRFLVNRAGETVVLHGVNLGAWLVWEDWLNPYDGAVDHYDVLEMLVERFGTEDAYALMDTFCDNFITEHDLDEIAAMGFNCVRVPFWYRNFYSDDAGTKILDENGSWDFSRLDWVVEEEGKRGLYVILDLHGAPGFQNNAPHSGRRDSYGLLRNDAEGELYRRLTSELWVAIAERYCGNPTVAMYDLLNEPLCNVDILEPWRRFTNEDLYAELYDAVRAVDPDHTITLECIWSVFDLPHPQARNWENVVYQFHFYQESDFTFGLFTNFSRLWRCDIPLYMGEFHPLASSTWDFCFKTLQEADFSWTLWTYKAASRKKESSDWCLRGSNDPSLQANVKTDSYDQIARAWGERQRTEVSYHDTGHYDAHVKPYV